ncbi:sensor histidine kinase [Rhodobacter sp. TJ_12]|uniref:sensor histidine kinase n=1 Tax=Rhodobacter sp. TJ_12 TaxID=2029399 RepID=UPI001CC00166|nr:sensor histidine kinase [Rhodobacter sp. TJ_12]
MAGKPKAAASVPLKTWLWRAYVRAALVPLLLIELGFLSIYWATSQVVYERSSAAVTQISTDSLRDAAAREANIIAHRLETISALTKVYGDETGRALATPATVSAAEKARHAMTDEGAFVTTTDNGGSAVFYSGVVPVGTAEKEKVWRTVRLDPLMRSIQQADPLIAQIYLNTWDSYNRIYPWFDVREVYAPKMDIPSYNFYYEADAAHNPGRGPVWTDAYVDPAGGGWMVSSIAPVYGPEKLEAVVGIDVTIGTIVDRVLDIALPGEGYAMLVGRDGTILALPPEGEADLELTELVGHSYEDAILEDTFKPAEFNIFARAMLSDLAQDMQGSAQGVGRIMLDQPMIAAWSTVAGPDWQLLVLAHEESILAEATSLRSQLAFVSETMVGILVVFYAVFFAILWRRANSMSARVARPLDEIETRMAVIAEGGTLEGAGRSEIAELQRVADHLVRLGDQLDTANRAKSHFLSAMSHELRTPLTAIIGYADLLEGSEGQKLDGERLAQVHAIARAGWTLVRLVDMVLDLSRLERQDMRLSSTPRDVLPIVETALQTIAPEAARMGLDLRIEAPEPATVLPKVACDGETLARILDQILSNAVKYNVLGGSVVIRLDRDEEDHLTIAVTDSGVGIAPEHRERVFEAFQRLGHENSAIDGAGIGLALARRFAEMTGCELTFESTPGAGTTFTLRMPVAPASAPG